MTESMNGMIETGLAIMALVFLALGFSVGVVFAALVIFFLL